MLALYRSIVLFACALVVAGCATTLEPAPRANQTVGPGEGAIAAENGVRMIARAGVWDGTPQALHREVTPMLVTIVNESAVPVRIAYNKFRLVSESGRRFSALPPFEIEGQVKTYVGVPAYPATGFGYAPYLSPYFAGAPIYPFSPNMAYWNAYGPLLRTVDLPTQDMLRKALPEGVLQPGGRVSGFVYFEGVGREVDRVRLIATFPNAQTGSTLTRLEIPFVVG